MSNFEKKIFKSATDFYLGVNTVGEYGMVKNEPHSNLQWLASVAVAWTIFAVSSIRSESSLQKYIVLGGYILLIVAIIRRIYLRKKRGAIELVINRKKGAIHFPRSVYTVREKTFIFSKLYIDYRTKSIYEKKDDGEYHLISPLDSIIKEREDFEPGWSYITWYMDKNRPLPPGTAFDQYRQADFERRKALGFPKPLYPSDIPTLEATDEQQEERERIGGW